jgi:hypothetical protein
MPHSTPARFFILSTCNRRNRSLGGSVCVSILQCGMRHLAAIKSEEGIKLSDTA